MVVEIPAETARFNGETRGRGPKTWHVVDGPGERVRVAASARITPLHGEGGRCENAGGRTPNRLIGASARERDVAANCSILNLSNTG